MQALVKNNKGFTTLEVIVVLCIVGIISAISYPALDSWNKGREVKADMLKAVGIFDNINSESDNLLVPEETVSSILLACFKISSEDLNKSSNIENYETKTINSTLNDYKQKI